MKISDHLLDSRNPAWHRTKQIILVAIVNSDVGIYGPDQYGIDAAVARLQIIQIFVDRIFSRHRIVEVPIFHHCLRLNKTGLRPLQFLAVILPPGIAGPEPCISPPPSDVVEPELIVVRGAGLGWSERRANRIETFRSRNLIAVRSVVSVLRRGIESKEHNNEETG